MRLKQGDEVVAKTEWGKCALALARDSAGPKSRGPCYPSLHSF